MKASLLAALLLLAPRASHACAVCMSGREEASRWAFLGTTIVLSLLPLGLVGGMVWWLRRRLRQLEADPTRRQIPTMRSDPTSPSAS